MTKPETARRLYRVALTKLAEDGCFTQQEMNALWLVEPSAGTGNFFNEMPKDRRIGIDINPLSPDMVKADFLTYELSFDPSVKWGILGNVPFRKGMPLMFINRAAQLGASFFALILPHTIVRASTRNKIDPYFECIYHEVLPPDSLLRDGEVKYSPTVFEVWIRRHTLREPVNEQTEHPDWEWLPRKRMAEATAWMQNFGQGVGDIKASDNLGPINSPNWHWFIKCEPDVLARLKAIDWRKVALPTASRPTLTKADVVRAYIEAKKRAITTESIAEPHASTESSLRHDVQPDRRASSVIPSTSPRNGQARKSADGDFPERCGTQALTDIWHEDPDKIADWMIAADHKKATEVWRALGDQLGLSDQGKKQKWYMRIEDQGQRDKAETRYNLPIIDRAKGWDTWHSKLTWLDGLSFEDKLREGPALLGDFDEWVDQVQGITPAWKKHVVPS